MSKKKKTEPLIYCGPSFPGQLQQFTIFKNGIPKNLMQHIEKCKPIERLFVPIKDLSKVKEKLKTQGSKESLWFNSILKYQKEV